MHGLCYGDGGQSGGGAEEFHPLRENYRRAARAVLFIKIIILIINLIHY